MPSEQKNWRLRLTRDDYSFSSNSGASSAISIDSRSYQDVISKGGSLPRWKYLISTGNNACTFLQGSKFRTSFPDSHVQWQRRFDGPIFSVIPEILRYECSGNLLLIPSDPGSSPSHSVTSARNEAIIGFLKKAQAVDTKLKGLVFLGELPETLRMIISPAKALRKGINGYLDAISVGYPRTPKFRRKKYLRDSWLEYSYGWAPLMSDIADGMRALENKQRLREAFEPVSFTGRSEARVNFQQRSGTWGPLAWDYDTFTKETWSVRYFGIAHSRCPAPVYFQARNYGLRLNEFVPTLWELIPYSFLVDYFTNIGDVLTAWSYRHHECRFVNSTERSTIECYALNGRLRPLVYDPNPRYHYYQTGSLAPCSITRTNVWRQPDVILGTPSFEFRIPGFGTKWINLLALRSYERDIVNTIRRL
jgi:hypothetical protein